MGKARLAFILAAGMVALAAVAAVSEMPWPETPDLAEVQAVRVSRVIDGDTIEVSAPAGKDTIRLVGIDAPEAGRPHSAESTAFLRNLLAGESVYLVAKEDEERDAHNRRLCYVYRAPDGLFVNLEAVRQGYAAVIEQFRFGDRETFEHYERRAKMYRKGMWEQRMADLAKPRPAPKPEAATAAAAAAAAGSIVAQPPPVPREDAHDPTVYITRTGEKYHRAGCRYLAKSQIPIKLSEARRRGYTPCKVCNPP